MITLTRTLRLVAVSAAILAVSAQVAQAKPIGPVGHINQTSTSSASYQGTYRPDMTTTQLAPDRQDKVGTSSQAQNIFPPATPVVVHTTTNSFDWTDAAIGAASTLAIVLVAAAALGVRGRRRLALGT